ncbi:YeeE/YedE thiosulfate transporter family protein [Mangrovivirga sp. M17]|uniref:YeeE/YedE thiosulfate transporter family protein n=1 Tax=Mangrovivirga halotolerans TaxID=2993936 RepID=A0ABT3RQL0_9BACT|nr:YeeE/YedE thiosulfate transporter family protein [Mangrovivirga halotolerans]MCX2744074.1 YeeE/YedE thiosulfate transporter family protein [Mangrovivirga halotolerans]
MNELIDFIRQPWPWYVAGPLIGLTVPALLILGNKSFGISSSLRHTCAACFPADIPFFKYNWKKEMWNMFFVLGILIGGFIAAMFLSNPEQIRIAESTQADLAALGITDYSSLLPSQIFTWDNLFTGKGLVFFVIGGFMVGFGTRYAGGCTSGHAIMGISNLQWPSLLATIFFMIGGIVSTHFLLPVIFDLFF